MSISSGSLSISLTIPTSSVGLCLIRILVISASGNFCVENAGRFLLGQISLSFSLSRNFLFFSLQNYSSGDNANLFSHLLQLEDFRERSVEIDLCLPKVISDSLFCFFAFFSCFFNGFCSVVFIYMNDE